MPANKALINIPSLDGLRGLAALLVVFSHAGNLGLFTNIKYSGQLGVGLFFCLSGFLMAILYGQNSWDRKSIFSYGIRRFFRVYPAYVAVLLLAWLLVVASSKLHFGLPGTFPYKMTSGILLNHLWLNGSMSVFWTIPVEMKFYLIFPFISALIYWIPDNRHKIIAVLVILLVSILMETKGRIISPWLYLEYFVGGMCAGYIFMFSHEKIRQQYARTVNVLFVLSLLGIFVSIPRVFSAVADVVGYTGYYWNNMLYLSPPHFAPMMSVCVLTCALSSGVLNKIFSNWFSRFVGKISYSLYLTHLPCLALVQYWFFYTPAVELVIALALSFLVSYILFLLVENPFRWLGSRLVSARLKRG